LKMGKQKNWKKSLKKKKRMREGWIDVDSSKPTGVEENVIEVTKTRKEPQDLILAPTNQDELKSANQNLKSTNQDNLESENQDKLKGANQNNLKITKQDARHDHFKSANGETFANQELFKSESNGIRDTSKNAKQDHSKSESNEDETNTLHPKKGKQIMNMNKLKIKLTFLKTTLVKKMKNTGFKDISYFQNLMKEFKWTERHGTQ